MTKNQRERLQRRDERLEHWSQNKSIELDRLDEGQRWVTYAALRVSDAIGGLKPLRRALTYFLSKAEMGLTEPIIGAITDVSDRSVRVTKAFEPQELVSSIAQLERGHRQPKLKAEHAGVVARILVTHPQAKVSELLQEVESELAVSIERHGFARYIERYGLGCLREQTVSDRPLFVDTPATAAPSS
jgi:hypothetical protein